MSEEPHGTLGYGFSREGLEEQWAALELRLPKKTPDCPLTYDLIELALGQVTPPQSTRLHQHLSECAYCRERFESQQRASAPERRRFAALAGLVRADVAGDFQQRRQKYWKWTGAVQLVEGLKPDGG